MEQRVEHRMEHRIEKRWEEPRLPAVQRVVTGTTVAIGGLLSALVLGAGVFARGLGGLIGQVVVVVVRSMFSAVGGFLAR